MPFALVIARGKGRGRSFRFAAEGVSIGRDVANDVVLNQPGISRLHARIERRGSDWALLDRGSANGTELNGRKVAAAVRLSEGDRIGLGPVLFEFRPCSGTAPAAAAWARMRPPARATLVAAGVLLLGIGMEWAQPGTAREHEPRQAAAEIPGWEDGPAPARPEPADLEAARAAYERGQRKLRERRIAPRNLYDAWRSFLEARRRLEGGIPPAPFAAALAAAIEQCERDLERECQRLLFSAGRFERYGEAEKAQQAWREVLLHFPGDDPAGCRKKAQENLVSPQPDAAGE